MHTVLKRLKFWLNIPLKTSKNTPKLRKCLFFYSYFLFGTPFLQATEPFAATSSYPFVETSVKNSGTLDEYRQLLKKNPYSEKALRVLTVDSFQKRAYKTALHYIDRLLKLATSEVADLILKGRILSGLKDYKEAETLYYQALEKWPLNEDLQASLAETLLLAGRYEEGYSIVQEILHREPTHQHALLISFLIAANNRNWLRANQIMDSLLDTYYNDFNLRLLAVQFYLAQSRWSDAAEQLQQLKIWSSTPSWLLTLLEVRLALERKEYLVAEKLLQQTQKDYPHLALLNYTLAEVFLLQDKLDQAVEQMQQALQHEPKSQLYRFVLERLALDYLPQDDQLRQSLAAERFTLGTQASESWQYRLSQRHWRRALQLSPNNQNYWLSYNEEFFHRREFNYYLDKLQNWQRLFSSENLQDRLDLTLSLIENKINFKLPIQQLPFRYPLKIELSHSTTQRLHINLETHLLSEAQEIFGANGNFVIVDDRTEEDFFVLQIKVSETVQDFWLAVELRTNNSKQIIAHSHLKQNKRFKDIESLLERSVAWLQLLLPQVAQIKQQLTTQVVLDRGWRHGVDSEQIWSILGENRVSLVADYPYIDMQGDLDGDVTITLVDENLSRGDLKINQALIPNIEGALLVLKEDEPAVIEHEFSRPLLFQPELLLRW